MSKKYLLVGGGSGGHITPLVSIAAEIKQLDSESVITAVTQKGETIGEVLTKSQDINSVQQISAGKFRRYHGESFASHVLDYKTLFLNTRDFFRFIRGTLEALSLLRSEKPDVIFLKGGFVSVPVGYAARILKIKYVTHDSDSIPGLANRLTAASAVYNLVAFSGVKYPYPQQKIKTVGIPISSKFHQYTPEQIESARSSFNLVASDTFIFVTGGGLGAQRLNSAVINLAFFENLPAGLKICLLSGKSNLSDAIKQIEKMKESYVPTAGLEVIDFTDDMPRYLAASDLVITRAGATALAEMSAARKPIIVVPGAQLTGGQQVHNARIIEEKQAGVILSDEQVANTEMFAKKLTELIGDRQKMTETATNLGQLFEEGASYKIANILIEITKQ